MTLNCPVNQQGQPLLLPQQNMMLFRPDIFFQVSIDNMGKKQQYGSAYITTSRIIFVCSNPSQQFFSFDIPIANLFNEKVEFPLLGSTYLHGMSRPYQNMLPGNSQFKLHFKKGGCDTFIKILDRLIKETRVKLNQNQSFLDSAMYNEIRNGTFNFNAFTDPNDPSKIFSQSESESAPLLH